MSKYQHDIEKYLKGELSPAERHVLEKKALNDPFLADALEGGEQLQPDIFFSDVVELNQNISTKRKKSVWIWPMRVAAGLILLAVSSYIIWQVTEVTETTQPISYQKQEQETIPPTSTDPDIISAEESNATTPLKSTKDAIQRKTSKSEQLKNSGQGIATQPEEPEKNLTENEKLPEPIHIEKTEETLAEEITIVAKSAEEDRSKKEALSASPTAKPQARSSALVAMRKIKGKVTSAEDGSPIPGVNVILKGTTLGTATNEKGEYEITIAEQNPTLEYTFIGLNSKEVIAQDRSEIDVSLSLDVSQLSEVVVVGYGATKSNYNPTVDLTHPTIGYRKFKQYLQDNLRYPQEAIIKKIEGRVRIEFTVEVNGSLTNFKVLKSIGAGCDEELIRLIKEGPQWIPTKKGNVSIQDKARVELRFKLPK